MRNINRLPLERTLTVTEPTTQTCALIGTQSCDLSVLGDDTPTNGATQASSIFSFLNVATRKCLNV